MGSLVVEALRILELVKERQVLQTRLLVLPQSIVEVVTMTGQRPSVIDRTTNEPASGRARGQFFKLA
jgi:hypothetical protein